MAEVQKTLDVIEIRTTKFGMAGTAAQTQTSGSDQAALNAYNTGANGYDSTANAEKLYKLVVEIRAALVANGMMKGSA